MANTRQQCLSVDGVTAKWHCIAGQTVVIVDVYEHLDSGETSRELYPRQLSRNDYVERNPERRWFRDELHIWRQIDADWDPDHAQARLRRLDYKRRMAVRVINACIMEILPTHITEGHRMWTGEWHGALMDQVAAKLGGIRRRDSIIRTRTVMRGVPRDGEIDWNLDDNPFGLPNMYGDMSPFHRPIRLYLDNEQRIIDQTRLVPVRIARPGESLLRMTFSEELRRDYPADAAAHQQLHRANEYARLQLEHARLAQMMLEQQQGHEMWHEPVHQEWIDQAAAQMREALAIWERGDVRRVDGRIEAVRIAQRETNNNLADAWTRRARQIDAIHVVRRAPSAQRAAKRVKLEPHFDETHEHVPCRSEIDNHADTTCAGKNFLPIVYTGTTCGVKGFHNEMEVHDVPVATCATAWMHPHSGEVFIFMFNEALYFGDQLDHSLINPNQIRHFGIDVEDNPFRPRIGIDVREGLFIPFDKTGTTISFESRLPTAEELDQCTHIVLTSDAEWDLISADAKRQVEEFDQHLRERLDDDKFFLESSEGDYHLDDVYDDSAVYGDPEVENPFTTPSQAEYDVPEERVDMDDVSPEQYDQLIGAEFLIDPATAEGQGHCATRTARVIARATDHLGNPLGRPHANPMMDMREYDVEYEDGTTDRYLANQIAENLWSQCDPEGRKHQVFTEIVDHRKDNSAVSIADGFEQGAHGHRKPKKTTRGWDLLVEFVDGSTDWVPLKEVKAGNPVELAEYAVSNKIQEEPAFKWWVPYVIQKRNRIISKVKAKYWRTTHKFGVRLPKSVKEALELDRINKNHLWEDSMKKEMGKACVAYEEVEGCTPDDVRDNKVPQLRSFQEIKCHIIFDVKMDFTRKARFVAGGHMTEAPSSLTYSSVVSRDSVKIAFLLAALNDLDIMACDIGNAYLNAPCREKIWFEAGPECGALRGKVCKLVRALYGLKSSGAAWRKMFSDFIVNELNFTPSKADPDVYMRRATRGPTEAELDTDAHIAGADGTRMSKTSTKATVDVPQGDYYEYLLVYVDDVLLVSHDPQRTMKDIGKRFEIKNDAYGHPEIYLGAGIAKMTTVDNNREVWTMESKKYVEAAVQTVKDLLAEDGRELKPGKNSAGPLPTNYQPELDVTHECDEEMSSRFRQLIGILRWACELGRLDIQLEVSLMSQYQASPREGHLEALYLIFAYLSRHPMKRVVFDPKLPDVDESSFSQADWADFYGDVEEEDPPHMPEPLGNHVMMSCFVDANHAGNKVTRRSHTGVVILLNDAPIQVFCKRQNTVESSTFGSELVAMRIARDLVSALRIKLKWFGVPLLGPTNMFCDNEAVCKNTSSPESTLTKKHNAINFHICREAVAAGIMRVAKEDTKTNLADAFTKLLPYSRKMELLGRLLHNH